MLTIKVQRGSFYSEVKLHQKHRFGLIDWSLSALKTDLTKVANSWILSCVSTLLFQQFSGHAFRKVVHVDKVNPPRHSWCNRPCSGTPGEACRPAALVSFDVKTDLFVVVHFWTTTKIWLILQGM